MANVCWWFYFSKVLELSDTVSIKGVQSYFHFYSKSCFYSLLSLPVHLPLCILVWFRYFSSWEKRTISWPSSMPQWSSTGGLRLNTWLVASVSTCNKNMYWHTFVVHQDTFSCDSDALYPHSIPYWPDQLLGPCSDVSVLWPGSYGSEHIQIPVVETLPHVITDGITLFCCMVPTPLCSTLLAFYSHSGTWHISFHHLG